MPASDAFDITPEDVHARKGSVSVESDSMLLFIGIGGLLIIALAIFFLVQPSQAERDAAEARKKPRKTRAQRKAELKDKLRRRRAAQRRGDAATNIPGNSAVSAGIDMDDEALAAINPNELSASDDEVDLSSFKGSKKKLRKLQRKQEKRDRREWEKHQRDIKEEKREEKRTQSKYAKKLAAREEERLAREAEAAEAKRKEEEAAQAEFENWKDMFEVDEAGDGDAAIAEESQGLLQDFIDYVKRRKVVVLEDVAGEFGIRSQEVVSRLKALMSMGRLTGVLDDRGKFIYISEDEMTRVAKFVRSEGRISLAALAERSNELVDLNPLIVVEEDEDGDAKVGVAGGGCDDANVREGILGNKDNCIAPGPDDAIYEIEGIGAGRDKGKKHKR
jgi:hypothetical protein